MCSSFGVKYFLADICLRFSLCGVPGDVSIFLHEERNDAINTRMVWKAHKFVLSACDFFKKRFELFPSVSSFPLGRA